MYIVESLVTLRLYALHIPPHISHPPLRGAPGHGRTRTQRRHQDTREGAARPAPCGARARAHLSREIAD